MKGLVGAFNKGKALEGAFSGHLWTFVDSSREDRRHRGSRAEGRCGVVGDVEPGWAGHGKTACDGTGAALTWCGPNS